MKEVRGKFTYRKHIISQVPSIKDYFEPFLKKENFDTIIEIGTAWGGFTVLLKDIIDDNGLDTKLHTYDILFFIKLANEFDKLGINYYSLDRRDPKTLLNVMYDKISKGGKTLVLCDGGDKPKDFNLYASKIKSGDFIMSHDYCETKEIFDKKFKDKIWNWLECKLSDIEDSIKSNDLKKYTSMSFDKAMWSCYYKQ